jgi:heavy metal efflux system protein
VQVNTTVPALAPDEVEKLVTVPLEMALGGVAGVTEMRSLSRFGLSQITLQFTDNTDVYRARQLVTERLQSAADSLPQGLTPKLIPITTGLGEVFYYTLDYAPNAPNAPASREAQLMALWEIQEYVIKPQLRTVPGVAEVNAYGGYVKQIVVQPNIAKLRDAGLTVSDLAKVVGENVENVGGGVVDAGGEQLVIRGVGRVVSPEEIAELPVKFAAAVMPLRVKDLAEVQIGHAFRTGAGTHDGREALVGVAMMLMGENSHAVAERVAAKVEEIQKRLPAGVVISQEYNRKNLVHRTIRTVGTNLFEGALLVTAVLLLLLGNWRAALIVASAIPLAFLFAITGMTRFGISGNLMSLGAIDFGLIIDGAVVIVENVVRQLGAKQHQLGRRLTVEERLRTVLWREQASQYADVFRRFDHRHCLYPHSSACRNRRKNVPPDGVNRDAGTWWIIGAGINVNASSLLIPATGGYRGRRQRNHSRYKKNLLTDPAPFTAIAMAHHIRRGGNFRRRAFYLQQAGRRLHSEAR